MPMNARCRVLAVDLDGTLISNAEDPARPVSEANLAALKELRAAGARVVIITGRNEGSARSLLARCADPELAASDLILHNGALVVDGAQRRHPARAAPAPRGGAAATWRSTAPRA